MVENPLKKLESYGQSVWTDFIRRSTTLSGELGRWIEEDGITGVTSNPSIFEKAIAGSHDYDETIRTQTLENKSPEDIFLNLVIEDIQQAADLFRPVYDRTRRFYRHAGYAQVAKFADFYAPADHKIVFRKVIAA